METKTQLEMLTYVFNLLGIEWTEWAVPMKGDYRIRTDRISIQDPDGDDLVVFEFDGVSGKFREVW